MLRVMRDAHQIKSISPGLHDLLPPMEPPGYKIIIIGYRGQVMPSTSSQTIKSHLTTDHAGKQEMIHNFWELDA
jgi:hypothetical protein